MGKRFASARLIRADVLAFNAWGITALFNPLLQSVVASAGLFAINGILMTPANSTDPLNWGHSQGARFMRKNPLLSRLLLWTVRSRVKPLHRLVCGFLGSDFHTRNFGARLQLPHPFGIVVHSGVTIGDRCLIFQHVTIGAHKVRKGVATIGDDVSIGAGAVILGPVRIGNGAVIGANSVVLNDVPAGATAVGVPARVIERTDSAQIRKPAQD